MKCLSIITVCALISPLVYADVLRKTSTADSIKSLLSDDNTVRTSCQLTRNPAECETLGSCRWIDGRCEFKIVETCGFIFDNDICTSSTDCIWMSDERDSRPKARNNRCVEKRDVVANGKCLLEGLVIRSKSACNSVKGCSWNMQDDSESCTVASTQLQCADINGKDSCKQAGCLATGSKRRRTCVGRWETEFLSTLKKMKGTDAKLKIEEEYGDEKYEVVFIQQGVKERRKERRRNDKRIKLYLNKRGKVKTSPKFG